MSGFTKKDQDKSLFTVKKDSEGNTIVMRASGNNGGEIRGSILRTNEAKPYLVQGKGIKINSGSKSQGYPSNGQIEINVNTSELASDIKAIVSRLRLGGSAGPRGAAGPAGSQGVRGPEGPAGPAGDNGINGTNGVDGVGITSIVSNDDGTLTIGYGDGGSTTTESLIGPPGEGFVVGDSFSFDTKFKMLNSGSGFGGTFSFPTDDPPSMLDIGGGTIGVDAEGEGAEINPSQIFPLGYLYYDAKAHDFLNLIEDITWKVVYHAQATESEDATQWVKHRYFLQVIDVSPSNPAQEMYESQSEKSEWVNPGNIDFPNVKFTRSLEVDFTPNPPEWLLNEERRFLVFLFVECQAVGGTEEIPFSQTITGTVLEAFIRTEYTIPA